MDSPIEGLEIEIIEQCIADPFKVKIVAQADQELGDFLPYLLALDPRATHSEGGNFVTFKVGQSLVTVFADGRVTATNLQDEAAARRLLDDLQGRINDIYGRRDCIDLEALRERRTVSILEVLKLLPRTNCGECGRPTCMAFAVSIVAGEARTPECQPLYSSDSHADQKVLLEELLTSAGYGHLTETTI